jgi:pilus assembly protein CpaE
VFGANGGCGKTVVAANLAVALAKESRRAVTLVDVNLRYPDAATALGLPSWPNMADAGVPLSKLDQSALRRILIPHDSGVRVLSPPDDQVLADTISGRDIVNAIDLMAPNCSHVVVDTPPHFTDAVIAAIERSDDVLVVMSLDRCNVRNVKTVLATLDLLGVPAPRIKLVQNRCGSKAPLDLGSVRTAVGRQPACEIPSTKDVPRSVNAGVPLVLHRPHSRAAMALRAFAKQLATTTMV